MRLKPFNDIRDTRLLCLPALISVTRIKIEVRLAIPFLLAAFLFLGGCASRQVTLPITQVDPSAGYRFATRKDHFKDKETLVILAFSGGGTRAATFSYGVLEFLQRTEIIRASGEKDRLLDAVEVITGVSGGSFTALSYGLSF